MLWSPVPPAWEGEEGHSERLWLPWEWCHCQVAQSSDKPWHCPYSLCLLSLMCHLHPMAACLPQTTDQRGLGGWIQVLLLSRSAKEFSLL